MKNAFTLIELLAVIIILAIVALIATPLILDVIDDSEQSANMSQAYIILGGAEQLYAHSLLNENINLNGDIYSQIKTTGERPEYGQVLVTDGKISLALFIDGRCYKKASNENEIKIDENIKEGINCAPKVESETDFESPVLTDGLIPITLEADGTVRKADISSEWYNYENKNWANAVLISDESNRTIYQNMEAGEIIDSSHIAAYYVWIPRYEYEIFNTEATANAVSPQEININFVSKEEAKKTTPALGEMYTHPAFSYVKDDKGTEDVSDDDIVEIAGFWIGKFELTGSTTTPTVLPNVSSLRSQTVSSFFNTIIDMDTDYGLSDDINKVDSHMIKNMEWGAVAYLTNSVYGKNSEVWINNNSNFITGCGGSAVSANSISDCEIRYGEKSDNIYSHSTTGNISGIFDMSGGAAEHVMGTMTLKSKTPYFLEAEFKTDPLSKYYDTYEYGDSASYNDYSRGEYGDATRETANWNYDFSYFVTYYTPLFTRGGSYSQFALAGIFSFNSATGKANGTSSTRPALWINE